ncbi:MAG: TerB N-terminal domain-containing protein [Ruminococcus sp.]|jgi:hypothetical protein|nr:TerB N-terminal domain-containing protein [Ruminococcus sp.]
MPSRYDHYADFDGGDDFFGEYTLKGKTQEPENIPLYLRDFYHDIKAVTFLTASETALNFTDDYDINIPFNTVNPRFAIMSVPQLRCYFTLRKRFRKGNYEARFPSYISLYINEIINLTGFRTPLDAAGELAAVFIETRSKHPNLGNDLMRFIRDMFITFDIRMSYGEYLEHIGVKQFFLPDDSREDKIPSLLWTNCNYNISASGFIKGHPERLQFVKQCFYCITENLKPVYHLCGITKLELTENTGDSVTAFTLFSGANFCLKATRAGSVELSDHETYERNGSFIIRKLKVLSQPVSEFVGIVVKMIDATLRRLTGHHYRLSEDFEEKLMRLKFSYNDIAVSLVSVFEYEDTINIIEDVIRTLFSEAVDFRLPDGAVSYRAPASLKLEEISEDEPLLSYKRIKSVPYGNSAYGVSGKILQFVSQCKLIENLTDDYHIRYLDLSIYRLINTFSLTEFRTYLTQRTDFENRSERTYPTASFMYVYLSDFINRPHPDKINALREFADILRFSHKCIANLTDVDFLKAKISDFGNWLSCFKDFFIVNRCDTETDFLTFLKEENLEKFFPEYFFFGDDPELFAAAAAKCCTYKFYDSKFYLRYGKLYNAVFHKVFNNLGEKLLREHDINPRDLIYEKSPQNFEPFSSKLAFFQKRAQQSFTVTLVPETETYKCKVQSAFYYEWTRDSAVLEQKIMPIVIGAIAKSVEAELRKFVTFKGKISVSPMFVSQLEKKFQSKFSGYYFSHLKDAKRYRQFIDIVKSDKFMTYIRFITKEIYSELPPKFKIENQAPKQPPREPVRADVDFSKLDEIRTLAEETAQKLIIPDETEDFCTHEEPSPAAPEVPNITITPETQEVLDKKYDNDFDCLIDNLSETEREFLTLLISEKDTDAFLIKNNLMFEVLAEGINEKAADILGDIVIEDKSVIADYTADLKRSLRID